MVDTADDLTLATGNQAMPTFRYSIGCLFGLFGLFGLALVYHFLI